MTCKSLSIALAIMVAGPAAVAAQKVPATGMDVLRVMHDAYAGKWFTTLTFIQKTTSRGRDGNETAST